MLDLQFPQKEESVPNNSEFHQIPRAGTMQMCASAHLGCIHEAGAS